MNKFASTSVSYKAWTQDQRKRVHQLAIDIPQLHAELMSLGLIKTAHAMHGVVQELGWDMAAHEERERKEQTP